MTRLKCVPIRVRRQGTDCGYLEPYSREMRQVLCHLSQDIFCLLSGALACSKQNKPARPLNRSPQRKLRWKTEKRTKQRVKFNLWVFIKSVRALNFITFLWRSIEHTRCWWSWQHFFSSEFTAAKRKKNLMKFSFHLFINHDFFVFIMRTVAVNNATDICFCWMIAIKNVVLINTDTSLLLKHCCKGCIFQPLKMYFHSNCFGKSIVYLLHLNEIFWTHCN